MPSKFNEKLWALVRGGDAFRYSGSSAVHTVVMRGPYTGHWSYWKRTKHLSYSAHLDFTYAHATRAAIMEPVADDVTPGPAPLRTLAAVVAASTKRPAPVPPLPAFVYSTDDGVTNEYGDDGKHYDGNKFFLWHKANTKRSGLTVGRWRAFCRKVYDAQIDRAKNLSVRLGFTKQHDATVLLSLGLAEVEVLHAMDTNPSALRHKLEWLYKFQVLVKTMGVRKRVHFVKRVITHGPKKAMRASFRKVHPQTINSMVSQPQCDDSRVHSLSHKTLMKVRARVDALSIVTVVSTQQREDIPADYPLRVAEKFGYETLHAAINYYHELRMARGYGLCLDYDLEPALSRVSRNLFNTWHNQIVQIVMEHRRVRGYQPVGAIGGTHEEHWAAVDATHTVLNIRPLLTHEEFQNEGESMQHCIANYSHQTSYLYAHVDLKDISEGVESALPYEAASFQIDIRNGQIVQLYGVKNKPVSAAMAQHVSEWLEREKTRILGIVEKVKGLRAA